MASGEVDSATAVQPRWTTQTSDQGASEVTIELSGLVVRGDRSDENSCNEH